VLIKPFFANILAEDYHSFGRENMEEPEAIKEPRTPVLQTGAVLAVATAAVSLVAGLGTYLFIRFTQRREEPPGTKKPDGP
jgi:hypothetical protein